MEHVEGDGAARELAPWLILTPVVAGDGAMKWTSPYTGTACTVHPSGAWFVTRRDAEGTTIAARGVGTREVTESYLGAPQSLPARQAAARAVVEVDLAVGLTSTGTTNSADAASDGPLGRGTHRAAS